MTTQSIQALFDRWNEALQTRDPDEVVKCYAEDAILLPTVSNNVRHDHDEIRDYFVHFLKREPYGTIDEANVRELSDDLAMNAGVYTFKLKNDDATVQCRYTFLYRKIDGDWKIIEHHSSMMPETVA